VRRVRFNVELPLRAGASEPDTLTTLAGAFEDAGFGALGFTDHPSPSRKWLDAGGHSTFDPFAALSFCAAVTQRVRLMTYLAVLPYRNPLLTAKSIATVDRLSGGRFTLIAGAGYLRSEFLALGRSFENRNDLLDEALTVLTNAFSPDGFSYDGIDFTAKGQIVDPPPVQLPHPPIWIGGNSTRSRERVARFGTGWAPMMTSEVSAATTRTAELRTIDDVARAIDDLRARVSRAGRDGDAIAVQVDSTLTLRDGIERADEHLAYAQRLADIGVTDAVVRLPGDVGPNELVDAIGRYGERVIAAAGTRR
jgi:probable F420-dependent oxidoreductase